MVIWWVWRKYNRFNRGGFLFTWLTHGYKRSPQIYLWWSVKMRESQSGLFARYTLVSSRCRLPVWQSRLLHLYTFLGEHRFTNVGWWGKGMLRVWREKEVTEWELLRETGLLPFFLSPFCYLKLTCFVWKWNMSTAGFIRKGEKGICTYEEYTCMYGSNKLDHDV